MSTHLRCPNRRMRTLCVQNEYVFANANLISSTASMTCVNSIKLRYFPKQAIERFAVAAAEGQLGAVLEDHGVVTVEHRLEFFDSVDVHHGGTADAQEFCRGQFLFEGGHRFAMQMRFFAGVKVYVIVRGFDPVDVVDFHE